MARVRTIEDPWPFFANQSLTLAVVSDTIMEMLWAAYDDLPWEINFIICMSI